MKHVTLAMSFIININSLAPGKCICDLELIIFKLIFRINILEYILWNCPQVNASRPHRWDSSTLVQVMAWCRQATSHCLSQCWPRSMSPYGVTWSQWVNGLHCTFSQLLTRTCPCGRRWNVAPTTARRVLCGRWWTWLLIMAVCETPPSIDASRSLMSVRDTSTSEWAKKQKIPHSHYGDKMMLVMSYRADSRFAPSQWETSLQSNTVSHWLGANL